MEPTSTPNSSVMRSPLWTESPDVQREFLCSRLLHALLHSKKIFYIHFRRKVFAMDSWDGNVSLRYTYARWTSKGNCSCSTSRETSARNFLRGRKKKKNSSWHSPQREIPVTFFWQASNKYSHRSILLIFPWQARAIFFTLAKNMENKLQAYFLSWFRCKISLLSEAKGKESIKYSKTVIREKKVHLKGKTKDRSSGILPA